MPLTWEKLSQLTSKVPSRTLSIWAAPLWLAENKCCCLQQRGSCSLNFRLLNHSFICSFDKFLLRAYYVFTAFPVTGDRIREKIGQKNKKTLPSRSFCSRGLSQGRDKLKQMRRQSAKFKEVPTVWVNLALTWGQCPIQTTTWHGSSSLWGPWILLLGICCSVLGGDPQNQHYSRVLQMSPCTAWLRTTAL